MDASVGILPGDYESPAAGARTHAVGTGNDDWLSTLQRRAPDQAPAPSDGIGKALRVPHKALVFPEGEFVAATKVEDIANVEVCQAVLTANTNAGHVWGAVTTSRKPV